MENKNTQNINMKKHEKLLQDIDQLEIQMTAVKDKMHTLENEEKLESYKSNLLEVRKDNLKSDIEFYEEYSEKMDLKSAEKEALYLKSTSMNEYYDKLLGIYRDQFMQHENSGTEVSLLEINFEEQMHSLEKQLETLTSTINANSTTIKNLSQFLNI